MEVSKKIMQRVERERASHDKDDVLARAYALKDRFYHVWSVTERVRRDENIIMRSAAGKRVLDYGCGRGEYSLELLKLGANVEGIDISETYVKAAEQAARGAGYESSRYTFQVMDAHRLEFADNSFDFVIGNGILHHLDYPTALAEIQRVLKPGGRAVFQEPLKGNPLLALLRYMTPNARTQDEAPFSARDLENIATKWEVESTYYGLVTAPVAMLTSIILRPYPNNIFLKIAEKLESLFTRFSFLSSWNQYILFNLVKSQK
jgi:ubiquinone/menaquinone biosynthesis C-methylase UbiE